MNRTQKSLSWAVISVFILIVFTFSVPAQKWAPPPCDTAEESPAFLPYDFNDDYYFNKGVEAKAITGRRTGFDGLSVVEKVCRPNYTNVRVTATVPAYDQNGAPLFWYPLGDLQNEGFRADKIGARARQIARQFPMYVFPDRNIQEYAGFASARHAPIMDISQAVGSRESVNPLGLRELVIVNYTEKAFGKEGIEMMAFFGKKNGFATDDTPIIKSLDDINFLLKNDYITVESSINERVILPTTVQFAIAPLISGKGLVAADAFLLMSTKDGQPLAAEEMFVSHFDCMKKFGDLCQQ